jgi:Uma2 family endonuclease
MIPKMSLKQLARRGKLPFYIDNDGRPMGETPCHVRNVCYLLEPLEEWFRADSQVFVAGALVLHYEKGRRDRYLSPDVFVVRGVPKESPRRNYLVWEEGKAPDLVVELTSEWTRDEDLVTKRAIYQDVLRVKEYFLFDPFEEYLRPPLQGHRRVGARFRPIKAVEGRLPSVVLGLHLEAEGELVRLYDPAKGRLLPIPPEVREARKRADAARRKAEAARRKAETAQHKAEAEVARLRRELEELRRRPPAP